VRYARCGTPKQDWSLCERCSQEATGERLEIERLTSRSGRGHWKSTREGNSLVAYSTARPVRRGAGRKGRKDLARSLPYPASGSSSGLALVRQAKLGVSCGVKVPTGEGLANHPYRVLRMCRR
jgi:hypothetical protein